MQATVPSWAASDAPFVWDTTATSVTLGWPEPASNGGNVTGYEVRSYGTAAPKGPPSVVLLGKGVVRPLCAASDQPSDEVG